MNQNNYNKKLRGFSRELRNNSTLGEIILWKKVLRAKEFHGFQFNRQFIIGNYIVDFICRKLKLVIEIDGYSHYFKQEKDAERDKKLSELGYTVLRFTENEVRHNIDDVVSQLEKFLEGKTS
jgi:very-short-patch-repair endonuclease